MDKIENKKPVQICSVNNYLVALCDDGTLWRMEPIMCSSGYKPAGFWEKIADIQELNKLEASE